MTPRDKDDRSPESTPARREESGIRWGPFTARLPFIHTGVSWPELLQGFLVAGATGLGLVPLLQGEFGLSFDEAVACVIIQSVLISSAPILFGEPFAPGWITPALPLVLMFVLATDATGVSTFPTASNRFQFMTAVSIDFAILLFVLGVTGLGAKLVGWLPSALKGGIVMGAAIAALKRVFVDDADKYLLAQPVSTTVAIAICLLLTFSVPLQRYKAKYGWLRLIAGLGLLPGFLAAALVGPFFDSPVVDNGQTVKEIVYDIEWGLLVPPFGSLFEKVSPLFIGWPSPRMFLDAVPLALMGYVILFGDLITGAEILRLSRDARPDERIDVNFTRSHLSLAIRNALMAVFAPFFPTQGCLWTGVHVIIVQRWSEGRRAMASLFTGISSYYVFGVPLLYVLVPVLSALKPLMGIALSLTLVLTGFACSYVAMAIPSTRIERGVVILMAVTLAVFTNPWVGMTVGIVATVTLVGFRAGDLETSHSPGSSASPESSESS